MLGNTFPLAGVGGDDSSRKMSISMQLSRYLEPDMAGDASVKVLVEKFRATGTAKIIDGILR